MNILIIDDNEVLAESIAAYFEDEGVDSQIADSAEEAKRLFDHSKFDGAVVDFYLPGTDGVSWIEWALSKAPDLPCIVYTGSLSLSLADRFQQFAQNQVRILQKTHSSAGDLLNVFWKKS